MGARGVTALAAGAAAAVAGGYAIFLLIAGTTQSAATSAQRADKTSCATTLLRDWGDGRIDGTYPVSCYRSALKSLPTDLEVYSSAADDIRHAMSARIARASTQKISGHHGATYVRKMASALPIAPAVNSSTRPAPQSSRKVKPPR